uniref:Uncharacterized protein n=1 Tax=Spironucleus salmonicida TaxID=348837 RepID=V6LN76_9EUKA|eukprot:EST45673.1 hypothetical protein SS50377_14245 [Spironucleus salmonicida]
MNNVNSFLTLNYDNTRYRIQQLPFHIGSAPPCQLQISSSTPIVFSIIFDVLQKAYQVVVQDDVTINNVDFEKNSPRIPIFNESTIIYKNLNFKVLINQVPDSGNEVNFIREFNYRVIGQ